MNRYDFLLMLLLFLSALIVRLYVINDTGFDGLYGQDAYAYYDFAGELRDSIQSGHTPEPFFWSLGYPATLMTGFAFLGTNEVTAQWISIIMGALLAPLTFALASLITRKWQSAIIAGLLMVVCGQAVQSSIVVMADIPALFWATSSAVVLLIWREKQNFWLLALATALLTIGGLTRWLVLILAPTWALAVLWVWGWRVNIKQSAMLCIIVLTIFAPQIAFSLNNPFPTLNHAWVQGWSPANAFSSSFTNIDGQFNYAQINARYYAQVYSDAYYLAPIFAPFIALGLWGLWRERRYLPLMLVSAWAFLPYLFLVGIPYQNIRFPLIATPTIFVLVGAGFSWILGLQIAHKRPTLAYGALSVLIVFGLWQMTTQTTTIVNQFVTNQQRDKNTADWAIAQLPEDARLYTFGLTLTLQHYSTMDVYEIYYETPQTLADAWVTGEDDYLLLNVWQIENQWAEREPQIVYHWFRDDRGLTLIDRQGNYTLFRVAG